MTDSEQKRVNFAFRLPEKSRDELAGRLKTEGHKVQWFLEQCAMLYLREGRPPWEAVPAPNAGGVGLGHGTEYSSDVVSTLDKIYERRPVVARALDAAIAAAASELLIGKANSDARVPDNATIERLASETGQPVRDPEQAIARSEEDRRPAAKRTG